MTDSGDQSRGAEVKEIFLEASERSPVERADFLDQRCRGDTELRRAVESLLAAEAGAGEFFAQPTTGAGTTAVLQPATVPRAPIGPYKLLQVIGEGGFGTVYLAEQERPVRRRVALKVIKLGMDTNQVIARFEAERQALAIMDHPNIARVFDAGATENGRPYFVMELVKGEPITNYCDQARLTTQQRLELFVPVCQAVQHAHQKGIIHRDIKPSNVLVTLHDGRPVPKIIDFGVAKATQSRLTEKTLFTEFRQMIGTPEYMSPEQAEMSGLDIDTRSDVYSLGVLLYELLTGAPPFDSRELRSKAYAEMQRMIREVDPPRPSTRISALASLPTVAAQRSTEPKKLRASVRGELDWIVMKCLEKDRTRRYDSAAALASDIGAHLTNGVVTASPISAAYRMRKFARRHRIGLTVASVIVLSLLTGLVVALFALRRATVAKNEAIAAQKQMQEARASEAEARAYEKETDRFLLGMFESIDPAQARNKEISVREILEKASQRVQQDPPKHTLAEASLRFMFGRAFDSLGLYDRAIVELNRALELETQARGQDHVIVGTVLNLIGETHLRAGKLDLAEATFRRSLEVHRKALGDDHPTTRNVRGNLASCLMSRNKLDEADQLMAEVAEHERRHGVSAEDAAITANTRANIKLSRSQFDEAAALMRDAIPKYVAAKGEDDVGAIAMRHALADALKGQGKFDEAITVGERVLADARRILSPTHPITLRYANSHGLRLLGAGRLDEAAALYRDTIAGFKATLGEDSSRTLLARSNAALVVQAQGRLDEALAEFTDIAERMRRTAPPNDLNLLVAENQQAVTLSKMGRLAEAEQMMRDQLPRARATYGDRHPLTLNILARLGTVLMNADKLAEAQTVLREAYDGAKLAGITSQVVYSGSYGVCLSRLGRHDEAIPLLVEADDTMSKMPAPDRDLRQRVRNALIDSYEKTGKAAEAQRLRDRP